MDISEDLCEYPKGYVGPKDLREQITVLASAFDLSPEPALSVAAGLARQSVPEGAEGWFAVLSPDIVRAEGLQQNAASAYCQAIERMFAAFGEKRYLNNWRKGEIVPEQMRRVARSNDALAALMEEQPGGIVILPAQFGIRWRGISVKRVRERLAPHEFGLGTLEVGSMIFTHPERLSCLEELEMDCAGDEFRSPDITEFSLVPRFFFHDGGAKYGVRWFGSGWASFGSVTGFTR
jgi:hypothetical protein